MNKELILLLIMMLIPIAYADKIMVVNMLYDGNVTMLDSRVKHGFYPDRRYQPESGFRAELSSEKEVLDSFRFKKPDEVYVDGTYNGEISGGKILLQNTTFSLVVPYYENLDNIRIYDEADLQVGNISFNKDKPGTLVIVGLGISFLFIIILWIYRRQRGK